MGFPYVGITYCVGGWGIFGVWRILSREMGTAVFGLNSPPPSTKKSLLTRGGGDLKRIFKPNLGIGKKPSMFIGLLW